MRIGRQVIAVASLVLAAGCGDKATGPSGTLQGDWIATSWVYTNQANTSQTASITGMGATVHLTIAASTYSITYTLPGVGTQTVTGTYTVSGSTFIITETGATSSEHVTYAFSNGNNTLTMTDTETNYDFNSNGTKLAATLSMTLTRQ